MPEIKIKHIVSFSSEDKVHKAENILKSETYRKWKCAGSGEKNASIVLQFEKASQIHSIDIGNESSAFVEVLVGRSSDSMNEFQVLLVASSFMSPLESRNETHNNRVRMFGSDKLAQNLKDEKWDCVQIVCTQPFNKNITYGLSFIKFHSPPEKPTEVPSTEKEVKAPVKFGAFKLKYDDDDDEDDSNSPAISSWLERKNKTISDSVKTFSSESPSYASAVLASSSSIPSTASVPPQKRKIDSNKESDVPPPKKEALIPMNHTRKASSNVSSQPPFSKLKNSNTNKQAGKPDVKRPFGKLMENVIFVISGFVNPLRSDIRDKALAMGAKYKGDWDRTCTHLICAFVNTPKYSQVKNEGGRIVTKDWIIDCHKKRALLPWKNYMLSGDDSSESESEDEEDTLSQKRVKKDNPSLNGDTQTSKDVKNSANNNLKARLNSNSILSEAIKKGKAFSDKIKSKNKKISGDEDLSTGVEDSETEDEEAIRDYLANTDVESDSGGNTEDEILKVEKQAKRRTDQKLKATASKVSDEGSDAEGSKDSESLLPVKPDTSDLPLPDLPNFFKRRHFYFYGDFLPKMHHDLQRYITAYNGVIDDYMSENTKYVVTESKWDKNFDEALDENDDLIFVKPEWIFKCYEAQKLVPYQPYIIIPKS